MAKRSRCEAALVEQVDRLAERRVVGQVATLGGRIAERVVRDALVEQAAYVPVRRIVLLAVDGDALGLEPVVELVEPRRLRR